ncbi:hypothetical protein [Streptococcus ovis]|uniref:hypothetical protein n=1 Tax=Streptococcus ovis TaxID=82806 RepID=UPI000378A4D6|nr:hypothetical protein [Streptococcus ovis]
MKLSTVEKLMIVSPIVVNLILSLGWMQVDYYLDAYTKYMFLGLFTLTFYPIIAGVVLKRKASLVLYLTMHIATALIAIYGIYNDSALFYFYLSLVLFSLATGISFIVRIMKHKISS